MSSQIVPAKVQLKTRLKPGGKTQLTINVAYHKELATTLSRREMLSTSKLKKYLGSGSLRFGIQLETQF